MQSKIILISYWINKLHGLISIKLQSIRVNKVGILINLQTFHSFYVIIFVGVLSLLLFMKK